MMTFHIVSLYVEALWRYQMMKNMNENIDSFIKVGKSAENNIKT